MVSLLVVLILDSIVYFVLAWYIRLVVILLLRLFS